MSKGNFLVLVGVLAVAALVGSCGYGEITDEGSGRVGEPGNSVPIDPSSPDGGTGDVADPNDDPFPQDDPTCPSAAAVVSASNGWQSTQASQPAFDTLDFEVKARPGAANLGGLVAIGAQDISSFSDAAILVQFASDGLVDARDGSVYDSDVSFTYEPGVWYSIAISADLVTRTYDVEVGRCGEPRRALITGAAFRSDASVSDRLTTWAAWSPQSGELDVATPSWIASGSCAPATCESLGLECGGPSNGCGGNLSCGSCGSSEACMRGTCVEVSPPPPPPGGGGGGGEPGGPADTCTLDAAIGAACFCEGAEYTEGWCCTEGFSYSACSSTELYVLPTGTGSEDGSDWANALDGLPTSLVRDRVYWIGDGSYGTAPRTFNTAASGSLGITIRKATEGTHGTPTGWSSAYGDGQATFGRLTFSTDRYTLDGGEKNGIKTAFTGAATVADLVSTDADYIVLRNMEMDGGSTQSGGTQATGLCTGVSATGDYLVIDRCDIHDAADDGIATLNANHIKVLNSKIHSLPGCGTDGGNCSGPCFNGHSDGIEIFEATDFEIVGNMIYDISVVTSAIFTGGGANRVTNLVLRNNILYTPDTALTVTLNGLISPRIYNNVIWGRTNGNRFGGISFDENVTDLEMYNNIVTSINFSHTGGTYNPAEHHIDYNQFGVLNTGEYPGNANDQVGDPLFVGIPLSSNREDHSAADLVLSEFELQPTSPCINTGTASGDVPDYDIVGEARPQDGAWDRGAFEATP